MIAILLSLVTALSTTSCLKGLVKIAYEPINANSTELIISAQFEAQENQWIGIGFSKNGYMQNSRAMVAQISQTVEQREYQIKQRFDIRYPDPTVDKTSFPINQTFANGVLSFSFQRLTKPADDKVAGIHFDDDTFVMCAFGDFKDGKIYQHGPNKEVIAVDFSQ